jgi:hyperosmotically inducible periplasmic protein
MSTRARCLLLTFVLAATVAGCNKPGSNAPSETAGGPPGGSPPGPGGAPYAGAPGSTSNPTRTPAEVGDDVVMTGKVKNALITSKVDTRNLNVDTKEGAVILRGSVPTASQKTLAEKVAKQVSGVKSVKNALTVGAK